MLCVLGSLSVSRTLILDVMVGEYLRGYEELPGRDSACDVTAAYKV